MLDPSQSRAGFHQSSQETADVIRSAWLSDQSLIAERNTSFMLQKFALSPNGVKGARAGVSRLADASWEPSRPENLGLRRLSDLPFTVCKAHLDPVPLMPGLAPVSLQACEKGFSGGLSYCQLAAQEIKNKARAGTNCSNQHVTPIPTVLHGHGK
eukprot:174205-Pelagomonas_calceolata.AAC.1